MDKIESIELEMDLMIALDKQGISINKVLKSVCNAIHKKCGEDLQYLDQYVMFYGNSDNVFINYELYYDTVKKQMTLKLSNEEVPF